MNNFLISFIGIILVTTVISLLANFFDISMNYYLPFLGWLIALLLFNIFLDKNKKNIFMQNIKSI